MNIIDEALAQGASYADLRHDIKRVYTFIRENRRTTSNELQINAGFCLRVLVDGSWGIGIATREEDLPDLLHDSIKSARAQMRKDKVSIKEESSEQVKSERKAKKRFVDEDITDFLISLEDTAHDQSKRISSMSVVVRASERWMRITTSEQREIETSLDRTSLRVGVACKEGNSIESRVRTWGGVGGMEFLFDNADPFTEAASQYAWEADTLVEAQHSPSARVDCVLSHTLTGTLMHEAFGHGVEADLVVSNESILAGKIGELVASPCVNMVDDPHEPLYGYYSYDHEGVKAKRTIIVENGVLKSFLHSRETAAILGAELTGHCKAEFYSNAPIVRQGNTLLLPQDQAFEELLDMKDGLFLGDAAGGQVNVGEGTFTFGTQYTREIKNGELGQYLRGCSLSGNIMETMKKVDAVGKDTEITAGQCGKGQMDTQGRVMPNIRLREVMVGGRGR
ncbi:MAG: TldD/PmbA family protein [Theionarchaea archaeon]|nr:TldD/PmbA family protein [Theionarchaea archaeon]